MPIIQEWNIGDTGLAAIWKIEEPEAFFAERTGLNPDIKNEKRRIEHLTGRYLLRHLEADFPLHTIQKDQHDKPRTNNDAFFFSISHSWPYVAAVVDSDQEAGIDIQTWHPRIGQIKHKFLSPVEQQLFKDDPQLLTIAWAAKEAAYKWNGRRGVDFIEHLPIKSFENGENNNIEIYFNLNKIIKIIFIKNIINIDFTCSYVSNYKNIVTN